ncbi:MAG: adenosylcobinamide-phosphate synthase CbiB [Bacillota bacterium]|jgi:adenosylcobinamide-phosphate synthase
MAGIVNLFSIWGACVLDLFLGDPRSFPHPVIFIGKLISFLEKIIRKGAKTPVAQKAGGVVLTLATVLTVYLLTLGVLYIAKSIHIYFFYILNLMLLWTCLAARSLQRASMQVFYPLVKGEMSLARQKLSYIVGRDTEELNEEEIAKATVETVMENTSDGIIAPLFYMFMGGAPLAMAYKAVNTMDSMLGYRNEKYLHLGWASAKLDDAANFIPARITGIFLVVASFFLKYNYRGSFRILLRDRRNHLSPNCGYPEAAAAGALDIQLGGTHTYFQETVFKPTLGDDLRPVEHRDIPRGVKMMYLSSWLVLGFFSMLLLALRFN